eukprot:TRINITY_DN4442_c0_g1_i2.p1 TRINITY_DN4442_c0_g1~~TRINITY_DN4442_c0_g1_i2.p1  ORF type:complete len:352 (-),score=55.85 TRINITY_DN4442_c0_g1_i2:327-1382(-)
MAAASELVMVTGASGFLGCHIIKQLLEQGFRVRATVRDPSNEKKTSHIIRLAESVGGKERLEFFKGDLLTPGSFDDAAKGSDYVIHTASPVLVFAKDPLKEIVEPAVQGVENVLSSVKKTPSVKKVVLTSSFVATAGYGDYKNPGFTEEDWNTSSTLKEEPYPLSKTLAEKKAWEIYSLQSTDAPSRFELATICPDMLIGPVFCKEHLDGSTQVIRGLLKGEFPAAPRLEWVVTDVRTVAKAHIEAMRRSEANGQRFLLGNEPMFILDMAKVLREKYGKKYKCPTMNLPDPLCYAIGLFDRRMSWSFLRKRLGKASYIVTTKAEEVLGLSFPPAKDCILACADSIIEQNLI